jgi:hypothetical protein
MRGIVVALLLCGLGCGKLSVEAEGKSCPCPSDRGLECDSVCGVCVPVGSAPGAMCAAPSDCVPKIQFADFRRAWSTPNTILFRWDPDTADKKSVFASYRLELTPTLPAGKTRVYDASTHPELGNYFIANEGVDPNSSVVIFDAEPQVQYSARLVVKDVSNCEYSETVQAPSVPVPVSLTDVEIFGETNSNPDTLGGSIQDTDCHEGSSCFRMAECVITPEHLNCCDNLRVNGFSIPVNITNGDFQNAYLEFYANNESVAPNRFASIWLTVGTNTAGGGNIFFLDEWTFPGVGGEYRKLQFPLRELRMQEPPGSLLEASYLSNNPIHEFNWYTCITTKDATASFDEVYIRW